MRLSRCPSSEVQARWKICFKPSTLCQNLKKKKTTKKNHTEARAYKDQFKTRFLENGSKEGQVCIVHSFSKEFRLSTVRTPSFYSSNKSLFCFLFSLLMAAITLKLFCYFVVNKKGREVAFLPVYCVKKNKNQNKTEALTKSLPK